MAQSISKSGTEKPKRQHYEHLNNQVNHNRKQRQRRRRSTRRNGYRRRGRDHNCYSCCCWCGWQYCCGACRGHRCAHRCGHRCHHHHCRAHVLNHICITALPFAYACAPHTCEMRRACGHTRIMTSSPEGMLTLLNMSTNVHPNMRIQFAQRPMPEALLLSASTLAFLPHAGIMKSISGCCGASQVVSLIQKPVARWAWMHF